MAVTVLRRDAALPHPQGRLSDAPAGTVVADDVAAARGEVLRVTGGPGGHADLRPARLARLHRPRRRRGACPSGRAPPGLLTVDVPAGAHEVELAWSPPAFVPSVLAALLGAALAIGHALARAIGRRRSRPP